MFVGPCYSLSFPQGREDKRSLMDNMRRAVLVRRFLLLVGDLYTHQLHAATELKPRRDGKTRQTSNYAQYKKMEPSWFPQVPEMLQNEAADTNMTLASHTCTLV